MQEKISAARQRLQDALTYVDHVRKEKRVPGFSRELTKAEQDAFVAGFLMEAAATAARQLGEALTLAERRVG